MLMSPKTPSEVCAFRLYRPENNFGKDYGLYTATSSPTCPSLGDPSPRLFWISFAQDFQRDSVGTFKHPPCQPNIHATKLWFSWFGFSGSVNTCNDFSLSIHPSLFGFLLGQPPVAQ
jgi:hypothetical protein